MSKDLTRVVAFWFIALSLVGISIGLKGLLWPSIFCIVLTVFFFGINLKEDPLLRLIFISLIFLPGLTIPLNSHSDLILYSDRLRISYVLLLPLVLAYIVKNIHIILSNSRILLPVVLLVFQIFFHVYYNNIISTFQIIQEFIYVFGVITIMQKSRRVEWLINKQVSIFILAMFSLDVLVTQLGIVPWTTSYRGGLQGLFFAHELSYASFLLFVLVLFRFHLDRNLSYLIVLLLLGYMLLETNIKSSVFAVAVLGLVDYLWGYKRTTYLLSGMALIYLFIDFQEFSSLVSRVGTIVFYGYVYLNESVMFGLAPGFMFYEMRANLSEVVFTNYANAFDGVLAWNVALLDEARRRSSYQVMDPFMVHNGFLGFIFAYGLIGMYFVIKIFKKFQLNNRYKTLLFLCMSIMMFLHTKVYILELVILVNSNFLFYESSYSSGGLGNPTK